MNKESEKAAEFLRQLPGMRAELQTLEAEIRKLKRLMQCANLPSVGVSNYTGDAVRSGRVSDPTAAAALRTETTAARELCADIAALTVSLSQKRLKVAAMESALDLLNEKERFLIEQMDVDGMPQAKAIDAYREQFHSFWDKETDYMILRRRSAAYQRISKILEV